MPEELRLDFHFSNAFASREKASPVFLRHRGIRGSLKAKHGAENDVEKVKVVLKGMFVPFVYVIFVENITNFL
jgi:hypothetical protein